MTERVLSRRVCLLPVLWLAASLAFAQAPGSANTPLAFAVATVKPSKATRWHLQPTPDGYSAMGVSLRKLVQEAYGVYDDKLLTGGPTWMDSDKFDLEAKIDATEVPGWNKLSWRERADMLQPLLAERFHLQLHRESKLFPVYNLVVAKGGPRLQAAKPDVGRTLCLVTGQRSGFTRRRGCTVGSLDDLLRFETGRSVIDKTGLTDAYDFELRWTPEDVAPAAATNFSGPSIFTAVQEQLGLKLERATAPLEVLVIDHVERPSEN